ncbi:hypothetical protein VFPFJ_11427 [Purpureocillium lilacinum]|uniref:Uncharacterized protein n=1 Tax=Purpureocillium lilacinum TaxID=33203 RepID=A0A179FB45_PURLI|nr:hypothetical protein VFPFJ_11427 [Purpureocillium lilacinum]OAQ62530.1 hypothetical protein VFPFJ_11427 [Purpureocillium lilacinum]
MQHSRHHLICSPRRSVTSVILTGVATHIRSVHSSTACVRILFRRELLLQRLREGATQEQRADVIRTTARSLAILNRLPWQYGTSNQL